MKTNCSKVNTDRQFSRGEIQVDSETDFSTSNVFPTFFFFFFFRSGINKWRDARRPKDILEKHCETSNFPKPRYIGNNKVIFHGDEFCLDDFGKLSLSLSGGGGGISDVIYQTRG